MIFYKQRQNKLLIIIYHRPVSFNIHLIKLEIFRSKYVAMYKMY